MHRVVLTIVFAALCAVSVSECKTFENVKASCWSSMQPISDIILESEDTLSDKHVKPNDNCVKIEITGYSIPILQENSIADIAQVEKLDLKKNGITDVQPNAFRSLASLEFVDLSNNELTYVKKDVFNNQENIKIIHLMNNKIADIEVGAFSNMNHLVTVDLSNNQIGVWNPDWFSNSRLLATVIFNDNLIDHLPTAAFKNLICQDQFSEEKTECYIYMKNNNLVRLERNTFEKSPNIGLLSLKGNKVTLLDTDLGEAKIKTLDLRDNVLKCIQRKPTGVKELQLEGNHLDCTCVENLKSVSEASDADCISLFK